VTTSRHIVANAIATADGLGFGADEVYLGMFSVFAHPHELFHRSILDGSAFVLTDSLNPRIIAETVRRHGVTWMMAVPSFYEMLLDHVVASKERLPSLRVLEAGGAWVGPDALARMEMGFGATFLPVWGSTETTGVGIGLPVGTPRPAGAVGRAMPGYTLRLVREDGAEVGDDVVGELVVAGASVVCSYVNVRGGIGAFGEGDPFVDGAYRTGDLFRRDAGGMYHFVARRSEMLKIGGIRVYPLEIETALAAHPDVRAVAVVRAQDRIRGEVARAVVELQSGATMSVRAAQAWCRARLAGYKVPRIVEFREVLPRLPNGKLDRVALVRATADAS
jgi:acyl-CoA synthetase (AMP-forming)/AMP-acid ligase II